MLNILVMTPVGRTEDNQYIDYFPSRWSGGTGQYKSTTFYPFNLAYLSSYLKMRTNHNIKMIDANYFGIDSQEYLDIVVSFEPDVYIVEIDAIIYKKQLEIIKKIKKYNKKIIIIAAGPLPTAKPQELLDNQCDFVALGEFEESITELIINDFDTKTIGIYPNGNRELIDINKLPLPENQDIKRRNYCRLYGSEYNEVEVFATRGCPYMCNFCVYANVYAGKPSFRTRAVASVLEEIKYLKSSIRDLEGIFFNDESHTSNKSYIIELCEAIIKNDLTSIKYNCMTNYDQLDLEVLTYMKKAGYYKIRIGIESLDSDTAQFITNSKIKSNHSKLMEVLDICKHLDIKVYVTISVGTKESSYKKDLNSLNNLKYLYSNNYIQEFQLSINTPMPGTPFYDESVQNNTLMKNASYNGTLKASINYTHYLNSEINDIFNQMNSFRNECMQENRQKGINYSMYDENWCKPVYAVSNRKIGDII